MNSKYKIDLEEVLEGMSDIFFSLDKDWTIIYGNTKFFEYTLKKSEDQIGKNFLKLYLYFAGAHQSNYWIYYHQAMDEKKSVSFDDFYSPLNKWTRVVAHPKKEGGINIFVKDITEKKEAEERTTDVLESMSDAFFSVDKNWIINRVNAHHVKSTVYKREDQIGKNLLDLFFSAPEAKESKYWVSYHKAMNERVAVQFEEFYAPFDLWTLVRAYPTSDGGIAVFFTDTTEQKKASQKLQDALNARDEFLSIASHELKTPLTSLKLKAQLHNRAIKKKSLTAYEPARVDELVQQTEDQVLRLTRLVDDMFDISRIQTGKLSIVREKFNLNHLMEEVLEIFKAQFIMNGYDIPHFTQHGDFEVHWDRLRIEQVISNLLTNAIRYGHKNPVSISLTSKLGVIVLTVEDHGIGIPANMQETIFDRFERAQNATEVRGLGLGLFITKQIVLAHAGKIWVESEEGKGSRFLIEIPKN